MTYETALSALADPTRRAVFETLRFKEHTVSEIAEGQSVSRPAVSQHLKILQQAGLVAARPEGTKRYYYVRHEGLESLVDYLERFWSDVLTAYADRLSAPPDE